MRDLRRVYGAQAADGDLSDHWSGPPGMIDRLATEVEVRPSDVVLDVGCGVGGPARRLERLVGCRVVGVDLLMPVLREARLRSSGSKVRFVAGSAAALPVADGSVDQVWALGLVAHLPDVEVFARQGARVLRPGGVLAVTEALWDGYRTPRFLDSAPRPWRPLTIEALSAALGDAGLRVEDRAWPGIGLPAALEARDPRLRADLADGRLVPGLLIGRKVAS